MQLFQSEHDMQVWLRTALKSVAGIGELIRNDEYLSGFKSKNFEEEKFLYSFLYSFEALHLTKVISDNENISLKIGDILKPDFLLYSLDKESIVIVELKNISKPTRQAGTELSAYAGEVRTIIPFIADSDIINVIISTEWPTLLKHYISHEIIWLNRNIICLEPKKENGDILLEIKAIEFFLEKHNALNLSYRNLRGYQICLYDKELYKSEYDSNRLDRHIEQFKTALLSMAVKGNSLKNHGFAFLWRNNCQNILALYNITLINYAPFHNIERFIKQNKNIKAPDIQKKFINILQEYSPTGHCQSIFEVARHSYKFLTQVCSPEIEALTDWAFLRNEMHSKGKLIAFQGWGLFGELFYERLSKEYDNGNINILSSCPDLALDIIDSLVDENYPFID